MLRVLLKITRGAFTVFVLGLCHPHSINGRRLNTAEEADESTRSTVLKALEQGEVTRDGEQTWHVVRLLVVTPAEFGTSQGIIPLFIMKCSIGLEHGE